MSFAAKVPRGTMIKWQYYGTMVLYLWIVAWNISKNIYFSTFLGVGVALYSDQILQTEKSIKYQKPFYCWKYTTVQKFKICKTCTNSFLQTANVTI